MKADKLVTGNWELTSELGEHGVYEDLDGLMDYVYRSRPRTMELQVDFDDGGEEKIAPVFVIPFDL